MQPSYAHACTCTRMITVEIKIVIIFGTNQEHLLATTMRL